MPEILVAWWGKYSSGGSEGDDPHHAWVPDGSDREIVRYINDEILPGTTDEDYGSEHWRGVAFRRLSAAEVRAHEMKTLRNRITTLLATFEDSNQKDCEAILDSMTGEPKKLERMFRLQGILNQVLVKK